MERIRTAGAGRDHVRRRIPAAQRTAGRQGTRGADAGIRVGVGGRRGRSAPRRSPGVPDAEKDGPTLGARGRRGEGRGDIDVDHRRRRHRRRGGGEEFANRTVMLPLVRRLAGDMPRGVGSVARVTVLCVTVARVVAGVRRRGFCRGGLVVASLGVALLGVIVPRVVVLVPRRDGDDRGQIRRQRRDRGDAAASPPAPAESRTAGGPAGAGAGGGGGAGEEHGAEYTVGAGQNGGGPREPSTSCGRAVWDST